MSHKVILGNSKCKLSEVFEHIDLMMAFRHQSGAAEWVMGCIFLSRPSQCFS